MLKISSVNDVTCADFKNLFTAYYSELDCGEDCAHLLDEYILPDLLAGLIYIDLLDEDNKTVGFIIYQKDDIDNEWNLKEGWGDIREIYVLPESRKKGLGTFMLLTAEFKLKEKGVEKCYCLPLETSEKFFETNGYVRGNEYSGELECFVFEKTDLSHRCK